VVAPNNRNICQAALETIQQQASTGKKKDHKALEQQFSVLYQNIQLFCRSAEEVAGNKHSHSAIHHFFSN